MLTWARVIPTPVEHYTDLLNAGTRFAFSRWGDGEWQALLGRRLGTNCDGAKYEVVLTEKLQRVLKSRPKYMLGTQPLALKLFGLLINRFLTENVLHGLTWHDADVFHWAISHDDRHEAFRGFLRALRPRRLIVAGPAHMRGPLRELLGYAAFVEVPPSVCVHHAGRLLAEISQAIDASNEPSVVSLSCGMLAEVILDELWHWDRGQSLIDMGAVWDPYCGVNSRTYTRTLSAGGWQPPR